MNKIVHKLLLAGDEFMSKMYLRQPGFTCSACGLFTKHKEKILTIIETGDIKYIHQNGHQCGLALLVYNCLEKKHSRGSNQINN